MSVFKQAYHTINNIIHHMHHTPIYNDACDSGLPVLKGDRNWLAIQHLTKEHGLSTTIKRANNEHTILIHVIDEFGTQKGEYYAITYHKTYKHHPSLITKADGFFTIQKRQSPSHGHLYHDNTNYTLVDPDTDPAGGYGIQSHQ